jgi:PAS domain S-box-containing protein
MDVKDQEIAYLKRIISLMPGNIYWKDAKGRYLGCNNNLAKALKLNSPEEIIGKTDKELIGDELAQLLEPINQEVMEKQKEIAVEEKGCDNDGNTVFYLTKKIPLLNEEGKVEGMLGISLDITERIQMEENLRISKEQAEVASQAKTQFLALASHELRIPLTGILGMASFLSEENITRNDQLEYIQHIQNSSTHLLSLINDILDFSKLEANKFGLVSIPVDLGKIIEETAAMLSVNAKNKGLALWIDYAASAPTQVLGDPRALRQIIINLLSNAIKFTQEGHIGIIVKCLAKSHHTAKFKIMIVDTGVGIPADKLCLVFERFQQVDSPYTRKQGGTGLGLAITKKLIELMNGHIFITSEVGKGSCFHVEIELPTQENAIVESAWEPYEANVRILVIDDTTRGYITCNHISLANCDSVTSNEAIYTLATAHQLNQPYHIVIIDDQAFNAKPETLLQLLSKQKEIPKVMALLLTSKNTQYDQQIAEAHGFFSFILKPALPSTLQIKLTSAWEKWLEKNQISLAYNPQILLIEDDIVVQLVHKKMLQGLGCEVKIAASGQKALELLDEYCDIIFMDLGLPDISGFELIKQIRKQGLPFDRIPIIALTGYSSEAEKQISLDAGANAVETKPIQKARLKTLIDTYIKK